MRALLWLALLVGCGRSPAGRDAEVRVTEPPPIEEAEALVQSLYDPYLTGEGGPALEQTGKLSASLEALLEQEARRAAALGELGAVDFDVVVNAQDWSLSELRLEARREGTQAKVVATFLNHGQPERVEWDLVQDGTAWRVDNVRPGNTDLRALLRAAQGASSQPAPVLDGPSAEGAPPSTP